MCMLCTACIAKYIHTFIYIYGMVEPPLVLNFDIFVDLASEPKILMNFIGFANDRARKSQ